MNFLLLVKKRKKSEWEKGILLKLLNGSANFIKDGGCAEEIIG